eukprot:CAMPEP_0116123004 /NCGR_PEP_ID=MMETSP0329-20121206/4517_1 /TAXON_ID=697910 /ORGANISM="Pseudo-nitzschia arenysensis, Strain B593" /LENGTH=306 /DNA_ID=CAMNT_0003616891 /DNA_START=62 /DNA_END=982 /DNA_ORIENTATION=+
MLMNYHGLTIEESKHSPQRRYQFIVICSIIAFCFTYSVYISGILLTIQPYETEFPGGTFCYKQLSRDYAASMGIGRRLQKDILEAFPEEEDAAKEITVKARKKIIEGKIFHVYLDNPEDVSGGQQRWMSGVLVSDDIDKLSYCDPLFEKNPAILREKKLHQHESENEKKASESFHQAVYESTTLPSVDSLAIKFPFSNGFTSSLVFSYKIIPEMRKLAMEKAEKGSPPVVISQCSVGEETCTHYIPLKEGLDFHMGRTLTDEHMVATFESFSLFGAIKGGLRVVFPFLKPYIDMEPAAASASEAEL